MPKRSLAALLAGLACAACTGNVHYVELVNTAPSSVVAFAVAPAGSGDFRDVPLGKAPLQGGGVSTTIAVRDDGDCLRDFRSTFADGRTLLQRGFDVCRNRSDHLGRYLR
ncbi:hypothetical protein ASG87_11405 [Frateuria sp. Soil773]|uniref:hypothetical protein n=1 Tax=Frateuria sp. Soil773 TaxID=1736407 RepID=UPI000701D947|nr:hypothetical protein [Frateuria sp. Soil773]KRF02083.1 hypothetical protein ASG87_11405 [Frateuria sp. Soil773]